MDEDEPAIRARGRVKQRRSLETYRALIRMGFEMVEERNFEAITISELARKAGYSVGAFYCRFDSKDEFFDAMVADHLERRARMREKLFAELADDELIPGLIADIVEYYWEHRGFWRAALIRSARDQQFWDNVRAHGHTYADRLIERLEHSADRKLNKSEETNVRFGYQVLLGTINNTVLNWPGPVYMHQQTFVEQLTRAFTLVAETNRFLQGGGS